VCTVLVRTRSVVRRFYALEPGRIKRRARPSCEPQWAGRSTPTITVRSHAVRNCIRTTKGDLSKGCLWRRSGRSCRLASNARSSKITIRRPPDTRRSLPAARRLAGRRAASLLHAEPPTSPFLATRSSGQPNRSARVTVVCRARGNNGALQWVHSGQPNMQTRSTKAALIAAQICRARQTRLRICVSLAWLPLQQDKLSCTEEPKWSRGDELKEHTQQIEPLQFLGRKVCTK